MTMTDPMSNTDTTPASLPDTLLDPMIYEAMGGDRDSIRSIVFGEIPYDHPARLSYDAIDADCRRFEFGDTYSDDPGPGQWSMVLPSFDPEYRDSYELAEQLAREYDDARTEGILRDADTDDDEKRAAVCELAREAAEDETERFEPMMSYLWPLPGIKLDPGDMQAILDRHTCCVLVELQDGFGLALCAGGMDMSATIALAYILCGYFPPASIRLPNMAGTSYKTGRGRFIAEALLASQTSMVQCYVEAVGITKQQIRSNA